MTSGLHTHTDAPAHTHVYMHTCVHTCTHIHVHTHKHKGGWCLRKALEVNLWLAYTCMHTHMYICSAHT